MRTKLRFVFVLWPLFRTLSAIWRKSKTSFWLMCIRDYMGLVSRLTSEHGPYQSARFCKVLYMRAKRLALKVELYPQDGTFHFQTKLGGLPTCLRRLEQVLRGNSTFNRRLALTILSCYRLLDHKVVPSYSSVFDPSKWVRPLGLLEEVERLRNFGRGLRVRKKRNLRSTWVGSQGPHGLPSCLSICYDAFVLTEYPEYMETVWFLWSQFEPNRLKWLKWVRTLSFFRFMNFTEWRASRAKVCLAKHTFLSEGGGKVRGVTPVNWFIQASLKPFHDYFMEVLRRIPTDCSFDEERGIAWVKEQSLRAKRLYSYDLSDATDRFPRVLLRDVVNSFLGEEIAKAWFHLMGLPILFGKTRQSIRSFQVGAPMGIYCLWPVFTLCHHAVVQLAARRAGVSGFFRSYVIRGDDIVIASPRVAREYKRIMEGDLDLKISLSKSFDADTDGPSVCEFAKRIFRDGVELSPFSVKQMKSAVTFDPFSALPIVRKLAWYLRSGGESRLTPNSVLPLFLRRSRARRFEGWLSTPWAEKVRSTFPPGMFGLSFAWHDTSPKHQKVAALAALEILRKRLKSRMTDLADTLSMGMSVTARFTVTQEDADNRYPARTEILKSYPYFIRYYEVLDELESLSDAVFSESPNYKDSRIIMALRELEGFGQSLAPTRRSLRIWVASRYTVDAEQVAMRSPSRRHFRLGFH